LDHDRRPPRRMARLDRPAVRRHRPGPRTGRAGTRALRRRAGRRRLRRAERLGAPRAMKNVQVDWDRWPVREHLAENHRQPHPGDDAVIAHHAAFWRRFGPGELGRTLEFGAGPNLYPLLLAAGASRCVEAVDRSAACVAYLESQLRDGPDESWLPFYARCRELNATLPSDLSQALLRVQVVHGD